MKRSHEPTDDAVALLQWSGIEWCRGPIPTGLTLLEADLRRRGGWQSPRLPEMALRGALEVPALWSRALDETERRRRYVHLIDKHSAYLGVCGGLELGVGHPQRHDRPAFDHRVPGYWRVELDATPWPVDRLPDPLSRDRRRRGDRWVTTPTLELARELDIAFDVREAWLWPTHRRLLKPFYDRIRAALARLERVAKTGTPRQVLAARGSRQRIGAIDALKSVYQALLGGGLASRKDRQREPHPPWYRPDWRHAVIAKSRANLLRNLATWSSHGVAIAAIYNDGAYVISDELAPPAIVRLDGSLGGYALKTTWPLEQMVSQRSSRVVPSLAWGEDEPDDA